MNLKRHTETLGLCCCTLNPQFFLSFFLFCKGIYLLCISTVIVLSFPRVLLMFGSEDVGSSKVVHNIVFPFAQWLGTSNCCMNPLVYCFFSQKIRRRIRAMLCCSKVKLEHAGFHPSRSYYSQVPQNRKICEPTTPRGVPITLTTHTPNGSSGNSYGEHYGGGNLSHHRVKKNNQFSSTHVWLWFMFILKSLFY